MSAILRRGTHPTGSDVRRLGVALDSKMESATRAATLVVEFAAKQRYTQQQCHEIDLAVREAVANAVLHGNRCDNSKKVFLSAEMHPSGLVITIRDEGKGFDPRSVPDPLIPGNLMQESGRGLFLVKAYMDEAVWRPAGAGGTEITLTKYPMRKTRKLPRGRSRTA